MEQIPNKRNKNVLKIWIEVTIFCLLVIHTCIRDRYSEELKTEVLMK